MVLRDSTQHGRYKHIFSGGSTSSHPYDHLQRVNSYNHSSGLRTDAGSHISSLPGEGGRLWIAIRRLKVSCRRRHHPRKIISLRNLETQGEGKVRHGSLIHFPSELRSLPSCKTSSHPISLWRSAAPLILMLIIRFLYGTCISYQFIAFRIGYPSHLMTQTM